MGWQSVISVAVSAVVGVGVGLMIGEAAKPDLARVSHNASLAASSNAIRAGTRNAISAQKYASSEIAYLFDCPRVALTRGALDSPLSVMRIANPT